MHRARNQTVAFQYPERVREHLLTDSADRPLHFVEVVSELADLSPTFLQSGTRDLFLSYTVRMHRALRRAKVDAELHIFEAMPHGGFRGNTPEDHDLADEVSRFVKSRWG